MKNEIYNEVYERVYAHSIECAKMFKNGTDDSVRLKESEQIRNLNRLFRTLLGACKSNTIKPRTALIDDISTPMWLKNFDNHVLPAVLKYNVLSPNNIDI